MAHITSLVMEKMPTKKHLYQIKSHTASVVLRTYHLKNLFLKIQCYHGNQTKWPLVIKHINLVDNYQMIITTKYGSHHFTFLFSHYKSMGTFCCHGNQTKRQNTKILAIFISSYLSNILTKLGTNHFGVVIWKC